MRRRALEEPGRARRLAFDHPDLVRLACRRGRRGRDDERGVARSVTTTTALGALQRRPAAPAGRRDIAAPSRCVGRGRSETELAQIPSARSRRPRPPRRPRASANARRRRGRNGTTLPRSAACLEDPLAQRGRRRGRLDGEGERRRGLLDRRASSSRHRSHVREVRARTRALVARRARRARRRRSARGVRRRPRFRFRVARAARAGARAR